MCVLSGESEKIRTLSIIARDEVLSAKPNKGLASWLVVCLLFVATAWAGDRNVVRFEHLGRKQGLTTDIITALYQDRSGLLWIGARDGLRAFDGHSYRLFDHDVSAPDSISDNGIRTIYEDSRGRLWVGTNSGGLELLDRSTGKFTHFRHSSSNAASLSHDSVYAIVEDRDGTLWVGTQSGLNRLNADRRSFVRFKATADDPHALANDYVTALHVDRHGALWIATVGGGICRRDSRGGFTCFRHDPQNTNSINSDRIFAIVEDRAGHLWLGADGGIAEFDPETNAWQRFRLPRGKLESDSNVVTSLALGAEGTLWAGTFDGLYEVPVTRGGIRNAKRAELGKGDTWSRVISVVVDSERALWVGTWGAGLIHGRPTVSAFGMISPSAKGLGSEDDTSILSDRSGQLWVGTLGGGLNRVGDTPESHWHSVQKLAGTAVLSVYQAADATIWIGTYFFLARIDPVSGKVTKWQHDPADPNSLSAGYVTDVMQDSRGQLWVATGGGGINRLRSDSQGFEHFRHSPSDPTTLSDDYVTVLFESSDGTLWVGTRSGGLNQCDVQLHCRRYLPGGENGIGHHDVTTIFQDSARRLWVGTAGGGLNLVQPAQGNDALRFVRFTTHDGLPDNNVMSIIEEAGLLWLGTRHGLARFDPSTHAIVEYSTDDGLPGDDFNSSAVAQDKDHLYFGTTSGVLTIARGTKIENPIASPTMLVSLRSLNNKALSDSPVAVSAAVNVPYGTILAAETAVLDFSEPSEHRFQYQLRGANSEWIDLGNRHSITFTDLSPGTYLLSVRGRNSHGIWSEGTPVELVVVPPVWMRWWFRLLVVLMVAGLIFAVHYWRTRMLEQRNRRLLEIQAERERALHAVETSEQALQAAYARLQSLARRVDAVAEEERRRIAHELHDEIGQVLTAAKINLQLMPSQTDRDALLTRVSDTIGLVDNMLARVRELSLDLRPPLLYELGLMAALRSYTESQAWRSGLDISIQIPETEMNVSTEVQIAVFRIVQEAVTNVIRHAHSSKVDIRVALHDGYVHVDIRDNGVGFNAAGLDSRTAAGDRRQGLAGIRERTQLLGGESVVVSGEGTGTSISVKIPVALEKERQDANSARR